ncbi:E3 ubiquitin-protein ligase Ufd4-like [Acropora millepora]|uniref:E3 ubiquitin-protein ligase Ufd4-like n=1 Tax=Acropora millepora TaxID=45264 RepID=UPI001CF129B3|nr:E3 ubiquitin-protein ligase Ufd4-like [Acropora millepora]
MEEKHRSILRHHWSSIRDNLEPKNILPRLVTVLIETDEQEIKAQSTKQERCDKLLEILPTRGKNAFNVFANALVKEAPHLASDLIEADKKTKDELNHAREQSAKLRGEIRKLNTELEAEKQNHVKTLQELKELKSLLGKGNETKEEETTPEGLQKNETSEGGDQRLRLREMPGQSENQTLENEIQELKTKRKDYQSQPQQEDLHMFTQKLELENEGQQEKNGQFQWKYKEPEDKVTNRTSELKELLAEIIQQHRADDSCFRCTTLINERDSTITEIQTLRNEIQELNKEIRKITKDYQPNTNTPHKCHQSLQEKIGNLPHEHKPVNKKHQEEIKDLQKKNSKRLEDLEKSKEKLEKDLLKSQKDLEKVKKDFACENERVKEYQQKLEKESKAKDYLLEQKSKDETQMKEENSSLKEKLKEEISTSDNLKKEVHRLRLTPKDMPGRIYSYKEDFDKRGVVYHLATIYRKTSQVNPSSTQIVATRSSDREGHAEDLLKDQVKSGSVSGTKDKEGSSWCVDLTEKYVLFLTHYTLRHGRERSISVLVNWRLEGSLDGRKWTTLKNHEDDHGLKKDRPYGTCTWAIDGDSNAFRYFKIFQTGRNSSGRFGIFLSGIELYGVLIEKNS